MTTTSVTNVSADSSATNAPSTRPLRLLTQLRTYRQNHLSGSPSPGGHRSYRESLTRAVGLSSPRLADPDNDNDNTDPQTHNHLEPTVSTQSAPDPPRPCNGGNRRSSHAEIDADGPGTTQNHHHQPSTSTSTSTPFDNELTTTQSVGMARVRAPSVIGPAAQTLGAAESSAIASSRSGVAENAAPAGQTGTSQDASPGSKEPAAQRHPTVRLFSYQDPNQTSRPSLPFTTITRTLPRESAIIRVGRYSERDGVPVPNPTQPSEAPVGFKSKVVSRKHCEFSYSNGQWHIKDVGSSSGTFLNHMRLSPPSMPSRLYAIRDGDIIQLGVDFKGGEEMIFRCVRIRLECNRAWQQRPNAFNKHTANLIDNLGKGANADYPGCRECSICLGSVLRPYQCLFMAACAHVWHYRCIRRLLHGPDYPMFQCPNCRAYTDLSAEPDDSTDAPENDAMTELSDTRDDPVAEEPSSAIGDPLPPEPAPEQPANDPANGTANARIPPRQDDADTNGGIVAGTSSLRLSDPEPSPPQAAPANEETTHNDHDDHDDQDDTPPTQNSSSNEALEPPSPDQTANIDIPNSTPTQTQTQRSNNGNARNGASPSVADTFEDCPLTPRNNYGPLALDSRAGQP